MTAALDPVIHPTHRLRICAMLATATTLELSAIKELLDNDLSKPASPPARSHATSECPGPPSIDASPLSASSASTSLLRSG